MNTEIKNTVVAVPADQKLSIMETEYEIPVEDNMRKDVSTMCNLSQGIREDGMKAGMEAGRKAGIKAGQKDAIATVVWNMNRKGYTLEQIADVVEKSKDEVEAVLAGKEPTLV